MITGIELSCGPFDGRKINIELPLPFALIVDGYVYYRLDADEPKEIEESSVYECVRSQRVVTLSEGVTP